MASASLIPEAIRAQIAQNYVASEREARFAIFHFGTFVVFAVVSLAAIHVDYMIVSERSEEHTSELQSLMRISYAVFCLKKKKSTNKLVQHITPHQLQKIK